MKKIFEIILILFCLVLLQNLSFANSSEEVSLGLTEINRLATPVSREIMLENANHIYGDRAERAESKIFEPEEDLGDSKVEKAFYKFVNDKVVNNKLNVFSMQLGEKFEEQ